MHSNYAQTPPRRCTASHPPCASSTSAAHGGFSVGLICGNLNVTIGNLLCAVAHRPASHTACNLPAEKHGGPCHLFAVFTVARGINMSPVPYALTTPNTPKPMALRYCITDILSCTSIHHATPLRNSGCAASIRARRLRAVACASS